MHEKSADVAEESAGIRQLRRHDYVTVIVQHEAFKVVRRAVQAGCVRTVAGCILKKCVHCGVLELEADNSRRRRFAVLLVKYGVRCRD